ncbi:DegT/DnrJ/EryC1/StrS family aminotransferase [Hwanghaeella grinnelliae]|uniref:DegT/DnrJ/EryC1/StrS family aminotransferase n=1 Tax=Hwanghaeella grinnelliae TaxID=2500179 RepID=A0A3S2W9U0_9PROT|nr:DegT/DnrJ/EryC1/StrS family aminotransferase [Hwanghaeella grinnelliae]RVU36744.1 DegT/DnrJ/EryC1/StrS family aminotransferase [Hwanghaeella grinnelliae]
MSTIPFVDLKTQLSRIRTDVDARIAKVLDHGRFIMGPEIKELEDRLSAHCGARHTISCSSGTDALLMAMMAIDIGPGDGVLVPAFTFPATAEVVQLLGATPVFVDIDPVTYNICPAAAARTLAELADEGKVAAKAILAVDLYGLPAPYGALRSLADEHGLALIGDAAQSYGASTPDGRVGTLADITAVSFFPAKPLGCFGDGGALLTDNDEIAHRCASIRAHGKGDAKYDIVRIGLNARMDTMQAAILLSKLDIFDDELASRQKVAARYEQRLSNIVKTPVVPEDVTSAWAQYTIRVDNRDSIVAALSEKGIPSMVYYPRPLHQQPAYEQFARSGLDQSEQASEQVLSLPFHPYLSGEDQERICDAVSQAVAHG